MSWLPWSLYMAKRTAVKTYEGLLKIYICNKSYFDEYKKTF